MLGVKEFLALSSAAYGSFSEADKAVAIEKLLSKIPDQDQPQSSALRTSLASYTLLSYTAKPPTGYVVYGPMPTTITDYGTGFAAAAL